MTLISWPQLIVQQPLYIKLQMEWLFLPWPQNLWVSLFTVGQLSLYKMLRKLFKILCRYRSELTDRTSAIPVALPHFQCRALIYRCKTVPYGRQLLSIGTYFRQWHYVPKHIWTCIPGRLGIWALLVPWPSQTPGHKRRLRLLFAKNSAFRLARITVLSSMTLINGRSVSQPSLLQPWV